jgi:hypothetical protein
MTTARKRSAGYPWRCAKTWISLKRFAWYSCNNALSNDLQPAMYTIGAAAKATGKAKSTISRDIDKGKISAVRNEDGSYSIDPSELHRVYPPVSGGNGSSNGLSNDLQPLSSPVGTGGSDAELQHVRERLSVLEGEREREREQLLEQIDDLRRRLDQSEQERRDKDRQLTALLTDQRQGKPRRSWWHWLKAAE